MSNRETLEEVIQRSLDELRQFVVSRVPQERPEGGQARQRVRPGGKEPANKVPLPLSPDAIQAGDRILRYPEETITERSRLLRFDRSQEWRARKVLDKVGLLKSAGKIGKWEFFEPTEKGIEWAKSRGIGTSKFKSGVMHEVVLRRFMRGLGSTVRSVSFQRGGPVNGVQPDVLAKLPRGIRIPVQVSVTNTAEYEAVRLVRLAEEEWVERVIMVTAGRRKADSIRRAVVEAGEATPSGEELRKKVKVWDAETVLGRGFDWNSLVEGLDGKDRE